MFGEDEMMVVGVAAVTDAVGAHADLDAGMLAHEGWVREKIELVDDYQFDLEITDVCQVDLSCLN